MKFIPGEVKTDRRDQGRYVHITIEKDDGTIGHAFIGADRNYIHDELRIPNGEQITPEREQEWLNKKVLRGLERRYSPQAEGVFCQWYPSDAPEKMLLLRNLAQDFQKK